MSSDASVESRDVLLSFLFASLADGLARFSWKRERIWKGRAAVFEFEHSPSCRIAFDVFLEASGAIRLHVVARDPLQRESLNAALMELDVRVKPAKGNGARFDVPMQLALTGRDDIDRVAGVITDRIRQVRELLAQWSGATASWRASNGVDINYVDREPRSDSRQLVVIFSSIRTKRFWLDFGGPYGDALRGIRGRVLFVLDDVGGEYCYHLRRGGLDDVESATLEFLRDYISRFGIALQNVVLAGMSKGATAAISLGSKLPGVRVLASVPQMQLGSYLAQRGDGIFEHMYGVEPDIRSISDADAFVPERLSELLARNCRVVVLTSEGDSNCFDVISSARTPWVDNENLEVIVFGGPSAHDHTSTLRYATPAFLGWLSLFCVGVTPLGLQAR